MNAIEDAMDRLYGSFGLDDTNCTRMFSGFGLNELIPEIHYYDQNGNQMVQTVLKIKESVENRASVKILDVRLIPVSELGLLSPIPGAPHIVVGELRIIFGKAFGFVEAVRRIPIYLVMESNRVKRCSISPSGSIVINQRICEIKNDGHHDYSVGIGAGAEIQNECIEKPNVKWFEGTAPLEATCPLGYRIAITEDHLGKKERAVCNLKTEAGISYPTRSYQSGFVNHYDGIPWKASVETVSSTCSFVSVTGVNAANFKPMIKCVRQ